MRGKQAPKRSILPDPKFENLHLAKLINYLMYDGKKTTAQRVVYDCLEIVSTKTKRDPVEVFETALKNVAPSLEVKSRRVGGANYQIPMPVRGERRNMLAMRWILASARAKSGRPMSAILADELIAAAAGEGDAIKKKQDVQKMAEANRTFAHFAR